MIFAGFGGQGVLFAGKVAAYAGLIAGKEISWLPSYGPEMRGGTANCSVCVSDRPIGSPLVTAPNVLVAMNLPSLDKFIDTVEPGGTVILDSSLIGKKVEREDLTVYYVPSSSLAEEKGLAGLSNMILTGKLFQAVCGVADAQKSVWGNPGQQVQKPGAGLHTILGSGSTDEKNTQVLSVGHIQTASVGVPGFQSQTHKEFL